MTSKDALDLIFDDLRQFEEHFLSGLTSEDKERYEIIKQDLDRLEVLEKEKKNREILLEQENNKLKKAIEILKNKLGLYVNDYINYATINAVLPVANNNCNRLTKQEYELLREVMKNE